MLKFVEIIPENGATVNKLFVSFNGNLHNILCNDKDEEILANPCFRGRLLFPFNDMIPNATYVYDNKEHTLDPAFETNTIGALNCLEFTREWYSGVIFFSSPGCARLTPFVNYRPRKKSLGWLITLASIAHPVKL